MPKNLQIAELLDIYGSLLNQKQKTALEGYYYYDLSLAEIAQNAEISRQGVRETIKRAENILLCAENALHLCKKRKEANNIINNNLPVGEKAALLYNIIMED